MTQRPSSPMHGEVVHYGYKTSINSEPGLMPIGFMESVTETWCAHCGSWVQTNGVLGPLRFMAEHGDGDCASADTNYVPPVLRGTP